MLSLPLLWVLSMLPCEGWHFTFLCTRLGAFLTTPYLQVCSHLSIGSCSVYHSWYILISLTKDLVQDYDTKFTNFRTVPSISQLKSIYDFSGIWYQYTLPSFYSLIASGLTDYGRVTSSGRQRTRTCRTSRPSTTVFWPRPPRDTPATSTSKCSETKFCDLVISRTANVSPSLIYVLT